LGSLRHFCETAAFSYKENPSVDDGRVFAILPATAAKAKTNAWSATVAVSIARFAIAIARFDVTTPPISVRVSVIPPLHITGAAGAITAPIFIANEPDVFS
jgi:hypothetical protein